MARIPEAEVERLKDEVSVQRLVEASGVELKKAGKDWLGRCQFHDDREASLVVSPAKNLWHCFGCQIGGGPIDWVMKSRGVSFRHAVELLKADPSSVASAASGAGKRSKVRALPAPVAFDADDHALLNQTIDYYHQRLKESPEALTYLAARGLVHPELIDTFKLGVADRTLGLRLPDKSRKAGADAEIGKSGSCHLFRHTMATLMLENGADIRYIQAILGHAELSTTQVYTQVSIRQLKAIHTATHPARLPGAGARRTGEDTPTPQPMPLNAAASLLMALDAEADDEAAEQDNVAADALRRR